MIYMYVYVCIMYGMYECKHGEKSVFQVHCLRQRRLNPEVNNLFMRQRIRAVSRRAVIERRAPRMFEFLISRSGKTTYRERIGGGLHYKIQAVCNKSDIIVEIGHVLDLHNRLRVE